MNEIDCFVHLVKSLPEDSFLLFPLKSQINISDEFFKFLYKFNTDEEVENFKKLYENVGFKEKDWRNLWNAYRNGLAHMAEPRSGGSVVAVIWGDTMKENDLEVLYKRNENYSFLKQGNGYVCFPDFLARDARKIKDFITTSIKNGFYTEDDILKTKSWMERSLES